MNKVTWKGNEFEQKLKDAISYNLPSLADYIKGTIQDLAPVDTGEYKRSIVISSVNNNTESMNVLIGSNMKVGKYLLAELLEFGTREMKPQPHYRPALDNASDDAEVFINKVKESIN